MRRMRCSSTLWTSVIRSKARLTRGAFRRRKWLFIPCVRWSFPVDVIAKRRFAPLWVFALIFATTLFPFPFVQALLLFQRGDVHGHRPPFHPRRLLDGPIRTHLLGQPV